MNKKAFTLMEILITVVIIGVLSSVVLPKFTRMLQTRKMTEAENILSAVRNEQEARCMIGKNYTDSSDQLASLPAGKSQHFKYELIENKGIKATASNGEYALQIPSYTDGRICCSDEGTGGACARLSRNYPECKNMDYQPANCNVPDSPTPPVDPVKPGKTPCEDKSGHFAGEKKVIKDPISGCTVTTTYISFNSDPKVCAWDTEVDNDCPCKVECPDGFVNSWCTCMHCDESKNMRVNADKTGCECTIDPSYCAQEGKVYWDNAATTDNFCRGVPECGCKPCEDFDDARGRPLLSPSTDGTVATCVQDICKIERSQCAKEGKILINSDKSSCECVPCDYFSTSTVTYIGKSSDGYLTGCEKENPCKIERSQCAEEGKILINFDKANCECVPCEYFSNDTVVYSGKSSDGYLSGCEKENPCKIKRSQCAQEGKILINDNRANCECVPCSYFSNSTSTYSGKSKDGTFNGCVEEARCAITRAQCAKEGKILIDEKRESCRCVSCDYFTNSSVVYKGASKTGYLSDCETENLCKIDRHECAKNGQVLRNEGRETCECVPCEYFSTNTYRYQGPSLNGRLSDCQLITLCEEISLEYCATKGQVWVEKNGACACLPCDSYEGYAGVTDTGRLSDCTACSRD